MANVCNNEVSFIGPNSIHAFQEYSTKFGYKAVGTYKEIYLNDGNLVESYVATKNDPKFVGLANICKKWNVRCEGLYFEYQKDFSGEFKINEEGLPCGGRVYGSVLEGAYYHRFQLFLNLLEKYVNEGQFNHIESFEDFLVELNFVREDHYGLVKNIFQESL